ncbi:hypothetical protein LBMAG42_47580 [Deltaproteobacteria bacterium]|nr:hypothetical protein LBMAG42_47580 [Deltaproteobacteria bacterium]
MLSVAALAVLTSAAEARPQFGLSLGFESTVNDPFVVRTGPRLGATLSLSPIIEAGASLAYYPVLGQGGCSDPQWTALSCQLLERNSVSPDISKMTAAVDLELRILPFQAHLGLWRTAVGLAAGPGMVTTEDDLVAAQAMDDAAAIANQTELHPTVVGGIVGEVRHRHFGVRIRLSSLAYIENIGGDTLEMKSNLLSRTEVFWWF